MLGSSGNAIAGTVEGKDQFFMFSTAEHPAGGEREAIRALLLNHVTEIDYLSLQLVQKFPELKERVAQARRYVLPASLRDVERWMAKGCGEDSPGLVIYDGEHWPSTPAEEQAQMAAAISRGKAIGARYGCPAFGVTPDGQFLGVRSRSCSYDPDAAIHRDIDWSEIALFDIQAQALLADQCLERGGVETYVNFVSQIAREVRASVGRPPLIVAQLSFRHTSPQTMASVIRRMRDAVDGWYLAYPSRSGTPCKYCSAANLEAVLEAIRDK